MPLIERNLTRGGWYHVFNRGLARRPLFDDRVDHRTFLALLAREVRRGRLVLHGYSLLRNHYHLIVESPAGDLPDAMRDVGRRYSIGFNRRRGRDGPLFRSRYGSLRLRSETYRRNALLYVDRNAVEAGLAVQPHEYEWASARHFDAGAAGGAPWLERAWVTRVVSELTGEPGLSPGAYRRLPRSEHEAELVAMIGEAHASRALDDPHARQWRGRAAADWLRERAEAADGPGRWLPLAAAATVSRVLRARRALVGPWALADGRCRQDLWSVAEAGLLVDLSGKSLAQVAAQQRCTLRTARRRREVHCRLVRHEPTYLAALLPVVEIVVRDSRALSASCPAFAEAVVARG